MSDIDRKARVRQYKETPRPAGIYRVRNTATAKSLVGSSPDLPGMLNRLRFQLENGSHPDRELQADWDAQGPDAFAFEVLDRLEPKSEPSYDPIKELRVLKEMWLQKLTASGELLYRHSQRGA
jgi:hypothetical protein